MRRLLNTLFVTSEDVYLTLDGENVVANPGKRDVARYPLHYFVWPLYVFPMRALPLP